MEVLGIEEGLNAMGDNDITIPVPDTPDVNTVVERPEQAMNHVVDHEHRLTDIENKQAQEIARLEARIESTQGDLLAAIEASKQEQAQALARQLTRLEDALSKLETTTVEAPQEVLDDVEAAPTEAVNLVPEVESTPGNTSKKYKGLRERRLEKRGSRNG